MMSAAETAFVMPEPPTPTARVLADAAAVRGLVPVGLSVDGDVSKLPDRLHFYGGTRLAARVQDVRPLVLMEPDDAWLAELPERFTRRRVELVTALDAYGLKERTFVKSPREKGVVEPGGYFGHELPTMDVGEPLLVSDLVTMESEFRFWLLDGEVRAASCYRRHGDTQIEPLVGVEATEAGAFVRELMVDQGDRLPAAVVVDVAWISDPSSGWAVVEANMAWFSGHYAADPDRVLDVVLRSASTVL